VPLRQTARFELTRRMARSAPPVQSLHHKPLHERLLSIALGGRSVVFGIQAPAGHVMATYRKREGARGKSGSGRRGEGFSDHGSGISNIGGAMLGWELY
jgi:hypothetical protein